MMMTNKIKKKTKKINTNKIIAFVKKDGTFDESNSIVHKTSKLSECNDDMIAITNELINIYDHAQILLMGNHAKEKEEGNGNKLLVSMCDLKRVMRYKWYLNANGYPATYGSIDGEFSTGAPITMHRFLHPNVNNGLVIDHINRNRLDNRRDNLRICTQLENSYNRSKSSNTNNNYKGVTKRGNKYVASITKNGKRYEIGNILTEIDAAKTYDIMAEELFGIFAGKNFTD